MFMNWKTVKMTMHSKTIYRFNATPKRILVVFLVEMERKILEFIKNFK